MPCPYAKFPWQRGRKHSDTCSVYLKFLQGFFISRNCEKAGSTKFRGFYEYIACLVFRPVTDKFSGIFFTNAD